MLRQINTLRRKFKSLLPQNKLRADYNTMVSRLKTLESQVENSTHQLENAKTSFLKNIYHEIRTPLNSIIGFTNLLNKEYLLSEQDKDEYTQLINKSSKEFLRKIDDIIQASLLEAGMIKINQEACNLGDFFEENHNFFTIRKHTAEKNNIALLLSVDEMLKQENVLIDKFRLTQILTHLIDNAFNYSKKGIVEYGCSLKGDQLEFFVKDTGSINLKLNEDLLFRKFSKVDLEQEESSGLGLGLSICKEILELMGGNILVESDNKSTTFYFNIPFTPANKEELQKELESKSPKENFMESALVSLKPLAV